MTPINWPELVAEAIRRRKAERMTQKEHAALAAVSIPTIVAFDRGERTLSLAKAFDILRVVGLIEEIDEAGAQSAFVRDAFVRWRGLTTVLPEKSPGRFPDGWYAIDYSLDGNLRNVELHRLMEVLNTAQTHNTGWPPFWIPTRPAIAPREHDGVLECWFEPSRDGVLRAQSDPAHCDYWQVSPDARLFLIRGYEEDSQDTFPPKAIFDSGLPIWRLGEALLHASRLAHELARDEPGSIAVNFRVRYTGLLGRILKAWANPLGDLLVDGAPARSDEATLEATTSVSMIEADLTAVLYPLVASLYERFGVTGLSQARVAAEVARLRSSRMPG